MVRLAQTFNASEVEPNNFDALPTGEYVAIVESSEMKQTKKGTGSYISLVLQILSPEEYKGRKLFENLNISNPSKQAEEIAYQTLSAISRAAGILNGLDETEDLHNKPMRISVGPDKNDKTQNRIKSFKPMNDSQPPVMQAQQSAPTNSGAPPVNKAAPWGAPSVFDDDIPF